MKTPVFLALLCSGFSCAPSRPARLDDYADLLQGPRRYTLVKGALEACAANWGGGVPAQRAKVLRYFEGRVSGQVRHLLVERGDSLVPESYDYVMVLGDCAISGIVAGKPRCAPVQPGILASIDAAAHAELMSDERNLIVADLDCAFVTLGSRGSRRRFAIYAPYLDQRLVQRSDPQSPEQRFMREIQPLLRNERRL